MTSPLVSVIPSTADRQPDSPGTATPPGWPPPDPSLGAIIESVWRWHREEPE